MWEVMCLIRRYEKESAKSVVPESGYDVLVWSRDSTESAVFVLFCFRILQWQMKLNEFECNVGSCVFNKRLPKRERTSFVPESGYASLLLGRFVFRKVEASDW